LLDLLRKNRAHEMECPGFLELILRAAMVHLNILSEDPELGDGELLTDMRAELVSLEERTAAAARSAAASRSGDARPDREYYG